MRDRTLGAYDIADLREMARRRLPKGVFEFFDRGNGDEVALAENRAAFERVRLNPHMLVDTSRRSQEITLFGKQHKMPIEIFRDEIDRLLALIGCRSVAELDREYLV